MSNLYCFSERIKSRVVKINSEALGSAESGSIKAATVPYYDKPGFPTKRASRTEKSICTGAGSFFKSLPCLADYERVIGLKITFFAAAFSFKLL